MSRSDVKRAKPARRSQKPGTFSAMTRRVVLGFAEPAAG
jgi:hypothetical protein